MSDHGSFWSDLVDWITDQLAFSGSSALRRPPPKIEATDGEEPTIEALRKRARQVDDHPPRPARTASSATSRVALDKEFWESQ